MDGASTQSIASGDGVVCRMNASKHPAGSWSSFFLVQFLVLESFLLVSLRGDGGWRAGGEEQSSFSR